MSAYMIVYARLHDMTRFADYVAAVGPLIAEYGGAPIARGSDPVRLEGDWNWTTAGIVRFQSLADAEAFWHSEDYAAVKALRDGIADFEVILLPELNG